MSADVCASAPEADTTDRPAVREDAAIRDDAAAREVAGAVPDPELPMVTIGDLGILRGVRREHGSLVVVLTPTYGACPAIGHICAEVQRRLQATGFGDAVLRIELTPPWTSDAITPAGAAKLAAAGISPPGVVTKSAVGQPIPLRLGRRTAVPARARTESSPVTCPRCGSGRTELLAPFGATACTSLYRCLACLEPFEHVKEI